eukprot:jgi/Picsp_1/5867/NSC_03225-R1_protein phosphatase 2c
MGQYLSHPVTTKESGSGENGSLEYGFSSMQGWRVSMEDDHLTLLDVGNKQTSLFAVFDGHGGQLVAKFTARYMPKIFLSSKYFKSEDFGLAVADTFYKIDELLETEDGKKELKKMGHVASKAKSDSSKGLFSTLEDKLQESESTVQETTEEPKSHKNTLKHVDSSESFIQSALARDSVVNVRPPTMGSQSPYDAASSDSEDGQTDFHAAGMGCTAVVAVIHGNKAVIANTGDSRCIISRKGVAEPLTLDHKPVLLEEAERIIKAGGFVRDNRRQSIKSICEEMCDNCLAPDLRGLCRGADNMSVIIVLFKHTADLLGPWSKLKGMLKF